MSIFRNVTNAEPGEWVYLPMAVPGAISLPTSALTDVRLSSNIRYSYTVDGIGDPLGPFSAGSEAPIRDGWVVEFFVLSDSKPGEDVFVWAEIGGETHHATVSTRAGDRNPNLPCVDVVVKLSEADGTLIDGAKVEIRLEGSADNGLGVGAVSQGVFTRLTNGDGTATFSLWQNANHPSKTYYEIRSWHPKTRKQIHTGQRFVVGPLVNGAIDLKIDDLIDIVN